MGKLVYSIGSVVVGEGQESAVILAGEYIPESVIVVV